MKPKFYLPVAILLVVIIISGYFLYSYNKNKSDQDKKNTFNSSNYATVTDLLSIKIGLECKSEENGEEIPTYIKDNKMATKLRDAGNIVFKDQKLYSWKDGDTSGFVAELKADEIFGTNANSASENPTDSSFYKFKNTCKAASISDDKFRIPNDISFKDLKDVFNDDNSSLPGLN